MDEGKQCQSCLALMLPARPSKSCNPLLCAPPVRGNRRAESRGQAALRSRRHRAMGCTGAGEPVLTAGTSDTL